MKQEITQLLTDKIVYSYEDDQIYLSIENQGPSDVTYEVNGDSATLASGESYEGSVTFSEITLMPTTTATVVMKTYTREMDAGNSKIESELEVISKGMSGDLVWVLTPSTVAPLPTSEAWTREVIIELQTASGDVHTWFNDEITTGVSIANTSVDGTASIESTTLTIVNGTATITVSGDAEDWLDEETDTLTVAEATILGYTVASATSVETFTAE